MALSTFERDVETTSVSALVADVKLLTDLLFDHIFHPLPSSRDKAERENMRRALSQNGPSGLHTV
jgi:hypothetical protein